MEKVSRWLLMALLFSLAAGCGEPGEEQDHLDYQMYYLNKDITKIESLPYEMESGEDDTKGMIDELIGKMQEDSGDVDLKR